ncbi:MAG TPA: hypothetical protein V6C89_03910 [Drouetiella sp.]|jgi:hypothetical protein
MLAASLHTASAADRLQAGVQKFESSIENLPMGDIHSSKSVKPLDAKLRRGNAFDKDVAERLLRDTQNSATFWYRVPPWCAGRWESTQAKTKYMKDNLSGKVDETPSVYQCLGRETIGHQYDRKKNIWNFCRENVWTHGRMKDYETNSFLFYSHPLRVTQNEVVVLGKMAVFEVNNRGRIISSYKTEVIDTMTPVDFDDLLDEQTKLVFNEDGKPVTTIKSEVLWKRTQDFQPLQNSKGTALKPLFDQFLRESGLKDLVVIDE